MVARAKLENSAATWVVRESRVVAHGGEATYCLVERGGDGTQSAEHFTAPDDDVALARALEVAQGPAAELWRGNDLIRRWRVAPGARQEI